MDRTELKEQRRRMIAEMGTYRTPRGPRRRANGPVRVVGYSSLSGARELFRKPLGPRVGRRVCDGQREREMEIVRRFWQGEADELDRFFDGELAAIATA